MRDHLKLEERGVDDPDQGGNLGAIGWAVEILAYTQANFPILYAEARGLRNRVDGIGDTIGLREKI
jgi:hypothetical protein